MLSRINLFRSLYKENWSIFRYCTSTTHVVLMRGMDHDTTEEDIIGFFKPLGITPKKINLKRDGSGRAAGFSEVEFNTHAEAVVALRKKNAFIGNRFIRLSLKPTNAGDGTTDIKSENLNLQSSPEAFSKPVDEKKAVKSSQQPGYFVRMKNVPWRVTDQDIYDFFHPVGARPVSVHPVYNESGNRTGEFDVEFTTSGELQKAAAKNNSYFRNKYVHLSLKQS